MNKFKKLIGLGVLALGITFTSCNKQDEIDQLNDDLRLEKAQSEALRNRLNEANTEISSLNSTISALTATNADLVIQLSEAEALAAELEVALADADANIESLNADVAELESILAETQAELADAIAAAEAQAAADDIEINELLSKVADLESQLEDARNEAEVDDALIASLEADLAAANDELDSANTQLRELIEQIKEGFLVRYAVRVSATGEFLGVQTGVDEDGEPTYKYPLLNTEGELIRNEDGGLVYIDDATDEQLIESFKAFVARA